MSASPDFMQSQLSDSLYSPQMGLALGLMSAGGPSRMPTSLGQALQQGFDTAGHFQQAGLQDQMQRMRLAIALARLQQQQQAAGTGPVALSVQ
jgi:hypothetical protein